MPINTIINRQRKYWKGNGHLCSRMQNIRQQKILPAAADKIQKAIHKSIYFLIIFRIRVLPFRTGSKLDCSALYIPADSFYRLY